MPSRRAWGRFLNDVQFFMGCSPPPRMKQRHQGTAGPPFDELRTASAAPLGGSRAARPGGFQSVCVTSLKSGSSGKGLIW